MFLAGATLVLIVLGALVTSNDAGLSVPDWPTSFGSLYKIPPMVGGVKYEHGHRMFAEFIGLLIIVMAVWTQRVEQRKWMKVLGWIALAAVIGQGVLGGLTVLFYLPWAISTAHATLAQTIFCVVTAMALFTSRGWLQDSEPIAGTWHHPEHADADGDHRGVRLGAVDSGRGVPAFRHQAAATPHRRVRRDCDALLDGGPRADALRQCRAVAQTGPDRVGIADDSVRFWDSSPTSRACNGVRMRCSRWQR